MKNDEFIRIIEFLHALKIVIAATNRLTESNLEALQKIATIMERGDTE